MFCIFWKMLKGKKLVGIRTICNIKKILINKEITYCYYKFFGCCRWLHHQVTQCRIFSYNGYVSVFQLSWPKNITIIIIGAMIQSMQVYIIYLHLKWSFPILVYLLWFILNQSSFVCIHFVPVLLYLCPFYFYFQYPITSVYHLLFLYMWPR